MSGGEAIGRVREVAPVPVGATHALPLHPDDGGVEVHLVGATPGVTIDATPDVAIYETAGAGENFSVIPAVALPATVANVWAHLISTAAAPLWIQIHKGQAKPAAAAKPYLVGDVITPIGGNTQWNPGAVDRDPALSNGYVVVLSTTQDTYTDSGTSELTVTALGRP